MNIWVDIKNLPDVLFFEPIVKELKQRGYKVFITARDYVQLLDLLDLYSTVSSTINLFLKEQNLMCVGAKPRCFVQLLYMRRK